MTEGGGEHRPEMLLVVDDEEMRCRHPVMMATGT
jgi:hypothetical protein